MKKYVDRTTATISVRVPNKNDAGSHLEYKTVTVNVYVDMSRIAQYAQKAFLNKSGTVREAKGGLIIEVTP